MVGRRELAARVFDGCGLTRPLTRLRGIVQSDMPILAYHRVIDLPAEDEFPFDPELVSASPQTFDRQMAYAARHFTPITFAWLASALRGETSLPGDPILITFDDGYLDNYVEAFPILQRHRIPATIFVSTGYISGNEPYWYDRVAYALYRHPQDELHVAATGWSYSLSDTAARRRAASDLITRFKRRPDTERRRLLESLAGEIDLEVDPADFLLGKPMTWCQVKEMHSGGIEFGSHAVSHPVLTQLDDRSLDMELRESKRHLEKVLGDRVWAVAYPFGGPHDYDARVIAAARRAGYRFGASYVPGRNDRDRVRDFQLRRLHVERYTSMPMFRSMLAVPQWFATG